MSPSDFSDLLERYRNGVATPDEIKKIDEWFERIERRTPPSSGPELHQRKSEMLAEILADDESGPSAGRSIVRTLAIAASAAASLLLCLFIFYPKAEKQNVVTLGAPTTAPAPATPRQLHFENQSRTNKLALLPDGSSALLYPGSSLSCDKDFGKENRRTSLSGKVFFEISHNAELPFTVWCNDFVTRVLGTSFWVASSHDSKSVKVTVQTGKVSVFKKSSFNRNNRQADQITLHPNQSALFSHNSFAQKITSHPVLEEQVAFQASEHTFHFVKEPVGNVLQAIAGQYGLAVKLPEKPEKCTFTGDLNDLSLREKLDIVGFSTGTSFKITDSALLIERMECE